MKKYQRNILIIVVSIILIISIIVFFPLITGAAYFNPYVYTEFENIGLNNIPVYSQIWIKNYNYLDDSYKKYYFNDSLILVSILRSYGNSYEIFIQAFSRHHEGDAKYYINNINIFSGNIEYNNKYNYPMEMINDEKIVENDPFDARIMLDKYYFKNKQINIIINITIERQNITETNELEYIFKPKTIFGLFRSTF
jgi:hypothetical protein